jgi:GT2 family glycosyltransferase
MVLSAIAPKVTVPELTAYPPIEPVAEGVGRPFWSVMIPTYNRAEYLAQTLRSVLEQAPGPDEMQIEVVDNCSTSGDIEAVVREVGGGRVGFYRQEQNVGMSGNWTTCVRRARGHWVHILHDDDMVMPGFYQAYQQLIDSHPEVVLVCCRGISINENNEWVGIMWAAPRWNAQGIGIFPNATFELAAKGFVLAPTAVVARRAYEEVGGFTTALFYTLDWEMWMRVATVGAVGYIHQPHFFYRLHSGSDTQRLVVQGKTIEELVRVREINVRRLPSELQPEVRADARRRASADANYIRIDLHAKRQHVAALRHAFWAFRLDPSVGTLVRIVQSVYILGMGKVRKESQD